MSKKMSKKFPSFPSYSLFFFLFATIFFSSLVAAGTFKQWTAVDIRHPIRIDGAVNSNILANITVKNPDGTSIVNFKAMTYDSTSQEHNYTVPAGLNGELGIYEYTITATGGGFNQTETFNYQITPSGQSGLLGFYFLAIILSYGVLGLGLWKQDITISVLGTFALFFVGLYVMFFGLDVYKNFLTEGFSIITLGVAFYVSSKIAQEYINI